MRKRRDDLVESCEDPDCVYCRVGKRVLAALTEEDVDTSTEVLTLVRVLAVTAVASTTRGKDLAQMIDTIVGQLRDDVTFLLGGGA